MDELFELANELENAGVELSRVESLLSLALTHLFEETMTPYAQHYEAVLESAWLKVKKQSELLDKSAMQLYRVGKRNN